MSTDVHVCLNSRDGHSTLLPRIHLASRISLLTTLFLAAAAIDTTTPDKRERESIGGITVHKVKGLLTFCTGWGCRMSHKKLNDGPNGPHWPMAQCSPFGLLFHFMCTILHPHIFPTYSVTWNL